MTSMSRAGTHSMPRLRPSISSEWRASGTTCARGYFGEAVRDAAIARAYLRPEMVVADIGSGTGFMAAGLAPLVAKVYAVDGSAAMLEVGREKLAGFGNVELQLADGATLPFDDASARRGLCQHVPPPLPRSRRPRSPRWCGCSSPAAGW